jgi:hypothetical protein
MRGRGGVGGWGCWAGLGGGSKQMSTMPNVAVGQFSSLRGTLGAHWGGKFYIWEGIVYCKSIWDVFVPQRGRGRAGEQTCTRFRSPATQIRQAVPEGFLGLGFAPGLVGLGFSWPKKCILVNTSYLHLFHPFPGVRGGRNGWMELERLVILS